MNNIQEMKEQAQYIWNRLDDLATSDPTAYKKFIEEQMKERELYNSAPEPRLCIYVKEEKGLDWFINICAWKRIPYPKNESDPIKLMCGFKHKEGAETHPHVIIPIAANDRAIDEILKSSFDKVDFIKLVMKLVENEQKVKLNKKFEICKDLFKGVLPADPRRLFDSSSQMNLNEASLRELLSDGKNVGEGLSTPESLLKKMSVEDEQQEANSNVDYVESVLNPNKSKAKALVEEIDTSLKEPEFKLNENQNGHLVLKINLPGVDSSADCDLTISETQVDLEVPDKYLLKVQLPATVDDDLAKAKFVKKSSVLTVTMPVLK